MPEGTLRRTDCLQGSRNPCAGVQPRAIAGGLLYRGEGSAGDHAGLFRVSHATGKAERLTSLVVQDHALADGVAVVNAGEDSITELAAIELASGAVRWRRECVARRREAAQHARERWIELDGKCNQPNVAIESR